MHPRLSLRAASVELLMIYLAANIAPPLTAVTISNIAYGGLQIIPGGMLRIYGGGGVIWQCLNGYNIAPKVLSYFALHLASY